MIVAPFGARSRTLCPPIDSGSTTAPARSRLLAYGVALTSQVQSSCRTGRQWPANRHGDNDNHEAKGLGQSSTYRGRCASPSSRRNAASFSKLSVPGFGLLPLSSDSRSPKMKLFRISGIPRLARSCRLAKRRGSLGGSSRALSDRSVDVRRQNGRLCEKKHEDGLCRVAVVAPNSK